MKNIIIGIGIALVVVVGYNLVTGDKTKVFQGGGVVQGSEYNSTTTIAASAGIHWLAKGISGGGICTLGSIVVASSSDTSFTLWNATSTTDSASTTITTLVADVAEGTYIYDITCSRGLIIAAPTDFDGSYTTTYR